MHSNSDSQETRIWDLAKESPAIYPPPMSYKSEKLSPGTPAAVAECILSQFDLGGTRAGREALPGNDSCLSDASETNTSSGSSGGGSNRRSKRKRTKRNVYCPAGRTRLATEKRNSTKTATRTSQVDSSDAEDSSCSVPKSRKRGKSAAGREKPGTRGAPGPQGARATGTTT